ncbi:MAG: hypothetical protein KF911_03250 [Pseudomonadales bacterium]|nr:hypothetical protein [Pseudomonadales bacterium]
MTATTGSSVIDQLVSSYFELPVKVHWAKASGLPFPDRFESARLEFAGLATAWMDLKQVVWHAERVRFIHGLPARIEVTGPSVEIAVGQAAIDRWLKRFELPYRIELGAEALIIHTEIAGFPIAELEAKLAVVNGWFVLQPKRASFLGVPNYVAALFRTYLPLPPLTGSTKLVGIGHAAGLLRLTFALEDFTEDVVPGMLARVQKRLMPTLDPSIGGLLRPGRAKP